MHKAVLALLLRRILSPLQEAGNVQKTNIASKASADECEYFHNPPSGLEQIYY